MRNSTVRLGLVLGAVLWAAGSALAANPAWLSATPPLARAGDSVVFTVTGPPGNDVALAFSFSSLGAGLLNGQPILLGPDFSVLAAGNLGPAGVFTVPVTIPPGILGEVFLQAGVSGPRDPWTLTNGIALFIGQDAGNGIAVVELLLGKHYDCGSTTVGGIEFNSVIFASRPIREATMQAPTGTVYRMYPKVPEPDFWMTSSGYGYAFGSWYSDRAGEMNLGLFPDGIYTFTVTFFDGATATATASLGGAFPSPATFVSPTCGAVGVSRGPTIQFTATGAARFEGGAKVLFPGGDSDHIWDFMGTATTVTVPSGLLWPNTPHEIGIRSLAPASGVARKGTEVGNRITTGP